MMLGRIYQNSNSKKKVEIIGINPGWIQVKYIKSNRTMWYRSGEFNKIFEKPKN